MLEPSRHVGDCIVGCECVWSVTYSIGVGHARDAFQSLVKGYVEVQHPYKRITFLFVHEYQPVPSESEMLFLVSLDAFFFIAASHEPPTPPTPVVSWCHCANDLVP